MVCQKVIINAATGLHARPARELVESAKTFTSRITLRTDSREVPATSIIAMLSLGLKHGSQVEVCATGDDEALAVEHLAAFLENME